MAVPRVFETYEQLADYLKSQLDDIEKVKIHVPQELAIVGKEVTPVKGGAAVLQLMNGNGLLIPNTVFEQLLNAGLLTNLRIPVELVELKKPAR